MRWVRFDADGAGGWGRLDGDTIIVQSGSYIERGCHHDTLERLRIDDVRLLPPCNPTKIVCIGRNYREHARELGNEVPQEPLFFLKPPSSLLAPGAPIVLPPISQRVDFEGELAIVIGARCRGLRESDEIARYIRGYTCLNDVTARDLQKKDGQWTRGKGFDTFCPLGPWIEDVPKESARPWDGLRIRTSVNGQIKQDATTADFIFPLEVVLRAITEVMTLEAGDVIATGTPSGVGPLASGDRVTVEIEGIGTLENHVVAA